MTAEPGRPTTGRCSTAEDHPLSHPPRAVCPAHVEDPILRNHITTQATETHCSYCGLSASAPFAAALDVFFEAFMVGVGVHFEPASTPGVDPEQVGREILGEAGISHSGLVADVLTELGRNPYWAPREHRSGNRFEQLAYSWEAFKHLVKHEMRYFFAAKRTGPGSGDDMTAMQLLKAVSDLGENNPAVWPAPCPGRLFRARMATSEKEASQWLHASDLGPPPPERAASNRMSPAGISMFYGATDRATAIAEAGAHAAHRYVVTGEFTPTGEIRLIDLTNLPTPPSIFDAAAHLEYFVIRFLDRFIHDLTLPVELDGREHIEYVPTQVFTEYFRYAFPGQVDGLMFPSTQGPGNNVAIFFGPNRCADQGRETEHTRLRLDTSTLRISRVITVAR
ncbi:RES domain-containing protein [Mycolicibacterium sp. BiH015]|uniref:RES domain-containing protein n=1 Tax=Mycolicibacterium sp. BiH015 TaxID=3018808 RepID=UPI0022E7F69D|nr:RES domain-containing protein [Mycolicibacterium sp. BiH015]MDA2889991.1 RES domain-containing protein [Mycolicibacterium sp. BiH015]